MTQSAERYAKATFAMLKRGYGVMKSARKIAHMYYIYSLKCKEGFYVGCTDDIEDRLERHRKGHVPATANRLPIELDFYFAIQNKYTAYEFEKYLKSGSGRAFIKRHFI